MASVFKRTDVKDQSRWYYRYIDETGKPRVLAGFRDKKQTERLAFEREETARRIREGLIDPSEERLKEHRARPIGEHLAEFEAMLRGKKRVGTHVGNTLSSISLAIDTFGWERIGDINAADFEVVMVSSLVPGRRYRLEFYADVNDDGTYDDPPVDHAWRVPGPVQGELVASLPGLVRRFTHTTDFDALSSF